MGHGHMELPKVPKAEIFRIEDSKELLMVQEELAKKGLKNPWLRNEVWRYHDLGIPLRTQKIKFWTRGLRLGIPAFLITIAIEKYFGIEYGHHGHGDAHGHGDH
ncbi:NADH dehydrogenase [ubiquinone] 1 beta subcomplex subunit 3 [Augochlora pura]